MLRIDLGRLDREGVAELEAEIAPDDPLWEGMDVEFDGPVRLDLRASEAGTGEVVVRGSVAGRIRRECRRCLEPVMDELDEDLTMVFTDEDMPEEEHDGDVRTFDADAAQLDVAEAVREEVVLAIDPFIVCDPECKGLCPMCGVNLNEQSCGCVREESDPRWDTLRSLQDE